MLRTLLLIENPTLTKSVVNCLKGFPQQLEVVGTSPKVSEGVLLFSHLQPDLVVVAERLADGEGMQFLRLTGSQACDRVFLCQSEDTWLEALRYGAVAGKVDSDISEVRWITSAIGHVVRRRAKSLNDQCCDYFASFAVTELDQIALPTPQGLVWIKASQVISAKPISKGVSIVTTLQGAMEVHRPFRQIARLLMPLGFSRDAEGHLSRGLGYC
jgi:DNA-binding NarL/FixJ family response regulator